MLILRRRFLAALVAVLPIGGLGKLLRHSGRGVAPIPGPLIPSWALADLTWYDGSTWNIANDVQSRSVTFATTGDTMPPGYVVHVKVTDAT